MTIGAGTGEGNCPQAPWHGRWARGREQKSMPYRSNAEQKYLLYLGKPKKMYLTSTTNDYTVRANLFSPTSILPRFVTKIHPGSNLILFIISNNKRLWPFFVPSPIRKFIAPHTLSTFRRPCQ